MKRPLLLAAVLVLLHQSPAMCQWYDVESGAPVADSSWRKTKDGFGAVLVVTDEFNSSRKEWVNSDGSALPAIHVANSIRRGDVVLVPVFFTHTEGVEGPVQPEVGYRILQPDGSIVSEMPFRSAWGKETTEAGEIYICHVALKFFVEPEEPLGGYFIIANCRQNQLSAAVTLTQRIEVTK